MMKNVIIVVLAAACIFLAAGRYMDRAAWEDEEISPAEYGGLLALRNAFSAGEYRDRVLPLLRQAFVDGKVTRGRLEELGKHLENTGVQTLRILEEGRTRDRVSRAWDEAREGAAALGESMGRKMGEAMRELGDAVEGLKPRRSPDSQNRYDGGVDL